MYRYVYYRRFLLPDARCPDIYFVHDGPCSTSYGPRPGLWSVIVFLWSVNIPKPPIVLLIKAQI